MTATTSRAGERFRTSDARGTVRIARASFAGKGRETCAVLVVLILGAAAGLVTPWAMGRSVDVVLEGGDLGDIAWLAAAMVAGTVATAALGGFGLVLTSRLFETGLARLRERMLTAAMRLPLSRIESAGSGDLVSRATDDVSQVGSAIRTAAPAISGALFTVVLTMFGLAALDWRFLLVLIVVLPVHYIGARMYTRDAPPVYRESRVAMGERAHHVLGGIRGLATVHAFDLGPRLAGPIDEHSWWVARWELRARIVVNRLFGRINLAEFLGMASILLVGFVLVDRDAVTVGVTTTAMLFFLRLFGPMGQLLLVMDDLQSGLASLSRIAGLIEECEEYEKTGTTGEERPQPTGREVVARGVRFGYESGPEILHGVDLTIADGEHVALVGASGAGKTTFASVVAGVHPPTAGSVTFGGVPIDRLGDDRRTREIALLTQEVHVFSGSVRDDLRMAAPEASDERLSAVLERIGAAGWVSRLPDGLDTEVGSGGHVLTPMQEQQLALARVILLDPALVILDEATADAGSAGADELERSAEEALRGRSALIVAHRLSHAATADRIVIMDDGRIVEEGSHDELVRRGGRYARLWAAWSRGRS